MSAATLLERIRQLPPQNRHIVEQLVEALTPTKEDQPARKFRFDWAGCLAEYRDEFTSVQLQKKILDEWQSNS